MSALELRASASLATLFALRMLGLFLILPVFAVHAQRLEGGGNHLLVGIALGAYGLTQGILQIPFGMAADRYGRKRVIVFGLVLFAIGSFVAAAADDIYLTIAGRSIQGTGAIAAAVMALAADLTREQHRTKAMAAIGSSIGLTFALSLTAAPALYRAIGMGGIFALTGVLALAGIWVTLGVVPAEPAEHLDLSRRVEPASLGSVLRNVDLLRLNFGIFALHSMQMAIFVVIPLALVKHAALPVGEHWQVYLAVVLVSFALMMPPILWGERRGKGKMVFMGSIALMLAVQVAGFVFHHSLASLVSMLLGFFLAFNILEAMLPSLTTRIAPPSARGTAIGVFNTTQALGLFAGGAAGGALMQNYGEGAVFVFGIALIALWLLIAAPMRVPGQVRSRSFELKRVADAVALRDQLVGLKGVRDAVISPERGVATLTVYPDKFDENEVRRLLGLGGEA
ncbi:MAG: MFS transporter [Betaproteobacteria bacterium]|nr:MFS transporter [Betaproteobacteria bacterium]MBI2961612.1 MFS transporter [Betaproteobacteria bacterium]